MEGFHTFTVYEERKVYKSREDLMEKWRQIAEAFPTGVFTAHNSYSQR